MATHSSILTWEVPRTEEPGRLQSARSQSDRTDASTHTSMQAHTHTHTHTHAHAHTHTLGFPHTQLVKNLPAMEETLV